MLLGLLGLHFSVAGMMPRGGTRFGMSGSGLLMNLCCTLTTLPGCRLGFGVGLMILLWTRLVSLLRGRGPRLPLLGLGRMRVGTFCGSCLT